jgi:mono/diheme cytochrome c family protein
MVEIISKGGKAVPSFRGKLSDAQIQGLLAWPSSAPWQNNRRGRSARSLAAIRHLPKSVAGY